MAIVFYLLLLKISPKGYLHFIKKKKRLNQFPRIRASALNGAFRLDDHFVDQVQLPCIKIW